MDIKIKVIPKSSRTELAGKLPDGTWKVKVAAPPEKGKANRALCAFLAEHFGVPQSRVEILSGETAHLKRVRVEITERPRIAPVPVSRSRGGMSSK